MDIAKVQSVLRESKTPAWLLYSFFGSNPLALDFLGLTQLHLSRRFAYLIPAQGEPTLIVHAIEQSTYCLLYTSPSPRDATLSRMPSSA